MAKCVVLAYHNIGRTGIEALLNSGYEISAVFTHRDNPNENIWFDSVAEFATSKGIPVFAPESVNHPIWINRIRAMQPDFLFSFYYRDMVCQELLDVPAKGALNLHGSLLPKYRGSAPYQWAVLNGEKETGVTAQHMVLKMDAGDIIDVEKTPIGPDETAGELLDRLAVLGAGLLSRTLKSFENGTVCRISQNEAEATFAPMLDKSMCPIDWTKSAQAVHDQVRGLHPWPVATMELQGKKFKVHETRVVSGSGKPGEILGLTKTGLVIACGEGAVEIRSLQAEGGKRMAAPDYFRGHPLEL